MFRWISLIVGLLSILLGCTVSGEPSNGELNGSRFLRCAALDSDGDTERFRMPPLTVERSGYNVEVSGITRGVVVAGLLAGIGDSTPRNLRNLEELLRQFKEASAQIILVAGGMGLLGERVQAIMDRFAKVPVPVLACPGAQENLDVFRSVLKKIRKTSPQVLDMTRVRRVKIGNVSIVSIPGYAKPFYLEAGPRGCSFLEDDLLESVGLAKADRMTVVLSPTPPRGMGMWAVDRGRGDVNIGDVQLSKALREAKIRFGLFGYSYESGGHATLDDGTTAVAPNVWQESLFVQAGSAGSEQSSLVGGGRSAGMGQIVEFSGGRARIRTIYANSTEQITNSN
jgi:hypothetical protein